MGAPALTVETRVLASVDTDALTREMTRAIADGDMTASSDAEGMYVLKSFAADPTRFGGAFDDVGLVGFVSPDFKVTVVRPDRRRAGVGRALIELAETMTSAKGQTVLLMGLMPGDAGAQAFLEATGFAFHSSVWDLDLAPGHALPAPTWPDGYLGRPFDRRGDVDAWIRVFNAAFADHATPLQVDPKTVAAMLEDPDQDDGDTIVVEEAATGELVGFCGIDPQRRGGAIGHHAELWSIGVRPDRQGQGLGRQLVRAGVERALAMGAREVGLSVNDRNDGALRLYESDGFVSVRTRDRWSRPVGPAPKDAP